MSISQKNKQSSFFHNDDNVYIIIVTIILIICVFIGLMFGSSYYQKPTIALTTFLSIDKISIANANFNIVTNISLTGTDNGVEWMKENKKSLKPVFESVLSTAKLDHMNNVEKIIYLSEKIKTETNKQLPHAHIKDILLTDFMIQDI